MKKITLMTALSFLMTACGGDSSEIPSVTPDDNNGSVENVVLDKVNPTLDDIAGLNKRIADAIKSKPAGTQADLEEYMGKYSYTGCIYKNNKYLITFKDGTQTVLDLNGYTSKSNNTSKTVSRSAGKAVSRTEQADTLLSNSKVIFWEPSPVGTVMHDKLGQLFTDYVGEDNVTLLSGADCTWQSLMGLSEGATVIINGLGFNDEWIVTGQEYIKEIDYSAVQEFISIYSAIVDGTVKHYYMVNHSFISKFIAPLNTNGIVFNASPSSFDKGLLADAFKNAGFPTYIGLDNMDNGAWMADKAEQFFSAMLMDRLSAGQAADDTFLASEEIQVPGIENPVQVACKFKGNESVYFPYTAMTDLMAIKSIMENYDIPLDIETLCQQERITFGWNDRINLLDLSGLGLSGSISTRFSHLTELVMLNLSQNQLTGEIPDELSSLAMLSALDLSDNQLTGNVPESFRTYYDKKIFINVSENQLNGQIPFGKLTDANTLFMFDHRYVYSGDGVVIDNKTGLWYADETGK